MSDKIIELPYPTPLFESNTPEPDYKAECASNNFKDVDAYRLAEKLHRTWCLYADLVQDEKLWEIINEPRERESDFFKLQIKLVTTVNELAIILKEASFFMHKLKELS